MDMDFLRKLQENIPPQLRATFSDEIARRRAEMEVQSKIPSREEYRAGAERRAAEVEEIPDSMWEQLANEDDPNIITPDVRTSADTINGGGYLRESGSTQPGYQPDWETLGSVWGLAAMEDDPNIITPDVRTSADTIDGGGYLREGGSSQPGYQPDWQAIANGQGGQVAAPTMNEFLAGVTGGSQAPASPIQNMRPDIFPETQEMLDVQKGYEDILANEEAALIFARSGKPLPQRPEEVDINDLTPADFEAGRQLARGEVPTANLGVVRNTVNAIQYKNMGGEL